MFIIFPYKSKCFSRSLVLVWIGSKLITNRVFEGFVFAGGFFESSGLLIPRSCYNTEYSVINECKIETK